MRRQDIKTGVVYAYRQWGPRSEPEPIVFLSPFDWIGTLYRQTKDQEFSAGGRAFIRAARGDRPRPGLVGNSGTIGYPAVLLEHSQPTDAQIAMLRSVLLIDFEVAASAWDRERKVRFLVVHALARVIGPWPLLPADPDAEAGQ